jgi:predicted RNA-binding protein YlqC (UPF0109 family)
MSSVDSTVSSPNYVELARFLLAPLLAAPDRIKLDPEYSQGKTRVLIRVALDESENLERILGRNNRNLKAMNQTLMGLAQATGHQARLEVFGTPAAPPPSSSRDRRPPRSSSDHPSSDRPPSDHPPSDRPPSDRPKPKPRPAQ